MYAWLHGITDNMGHSLHPLVAEKEKHFSVKL